MKITQYSAPPNYINEFKILNQLQVPDSLDYGLTAKEEEIIKNIVEKTNRSEVRKTRVATAKKGGFILRKFTRRVGMRVTRKVRHI
jgi:hypothetical protein